MRLNRTEGRGNSRASATESRLRARLPVAVALVSILAFTSSRQDDLASGLRDGMLLIYGSNGKDGPPTVVDSVRPERVQPGATCAALYMAARPDQPAQAAAHYCARGDTLFLRDIATGAWVAQRPIGPRMTIDFTRPNGNRVRYSTDTTSRATIGDRSFVVIHTVVLTMDSTGRPLRRLTERYAPALVTAVGGRFETADSSASGGWRETQVFELRAIHGAPQPTSAPGTSIH